jgi:hypothetical protein
MRRRAAAIPRRGKAAETAYEWPGEMGPVIPLESCMILMLA